MATEAGTDRFAGRVAALPDLRDKAGWAAAGMPLGAAASDEGCRSRRQVEA